MHWCDGGETKIDNLVLLCPAHHTTVHHQGWAVAIAPDGLPDFTLSPWIDPDSRPRRHHRYTLRQLPFTLDGHDPP